MRKRRAKNYVFPKKYVWQNLGFWRVCFNFSSFFALGLYPCRGKGKKQSKKFEKSNHPNCKMCILNGG